MHLSYKHIITNNIHSVCWLQLELCTFPLLLFANITQIGETPHLRAPSHFLHNKEQHKKPVYLAEGLGNLQEEGGPYPSTVT